LAAEADKYEVIKKFISRRNAVYLVHLPPGDPWGEAAVCKRFSRGAAGREKEAAYLAALAARGVAVPRLLEEGEDYLLLEYLDGPTLLDVLLAPEDAGATAVGRATGNVIAALGDWLGAFYTAAAAISGEATVFGDVNFRNFIVRDRVFGLDLEACRPGRPEEDVGGMAAYALTYTPPFTPWKRSLARTICRKLGEALALDGAAIREATRQELATIVRRRGLDLPPDWESLVDALV